MPRGRSYTAAEDALILKADRPRAAHIADAARALGRSPAALRKRAQRLRGGANAGANEGEASPALAGEAGA